MMLWLMFIIFLIFMILLIFNLMFSKKNWLDRSKLNSFECGFDMFSSSRMPFSIHFYLLALMFLVFDIEIIFLISPIIMFLNVSFLEWMYLLFLIIIMLLLGLEFEKNEGSLKWIF